MWNNSKSFLTTILPETPSLHMHEGTSDTAPPVSQYREKHSSIFPASGKASNLAVKCSLSPRDVHLSMRPAHRFHVIFSLPFFPISDMENWFQPSTCSADRGCALRKMREQQQKKNPNSKKNPKPNPTTHTTISDIPTPFSSSTCAKETTVQAQTTENKQIGDNH